MISTQQMFLQCACYCLLLFPFICYFGVDHENHGKIFAQAAPIVVPTSPSASMLTPSKTTRSSQQEQEEVLQQGGKGHVARRGTIMDTSTATRSSTSIMPDIIYANSIQIVDSHTKQSQAIDIILTEKDDPASVAEMIYKKYNIDFITYRWLLRSFQHGLQRLKEPAVTSLRLQNGNEMLPPVVVRFGDDLANLARTYSYQMGLTLVAANEIYQELISLVPQHASIEWVNERRKHSTTSDNISTSNMSEARKHSTTTRNRNNDQHQNCELTVAIATTASENISMFKNFVEKFPTTNLVCQVIIVVDEGSPPNVKLQMMTEYPQFTFVFKSKQDEGLANTLNTIVQLCKTRYLLYSSDAWEPLANDDNHLHDAISILKTYPGQKMAQVILNNQSTTSCSLGQNMSSCTKLGGWKRILKQQDGGQMKNIEYIENE